MLTKKFILNAIDVLLIGLCCTYFGIRISIKSNINKICDKAMNNYKGNKIEALISVLESETHTLAYKNNAIWALGKLNDTKALPSLKRLKNDGNCDHSNAVCQYEVGKAITKLEGRSIDFFTFR